MTCGAVGTWRRGLMQPVGDSDFEIEVKFESPVTDSFEMQGLIVQQDVDDFLRFDFYGDRGSTRVFAARVVGGSPAALANVAIPVSAAPLYLKVARTGDTWALAYSSDGSAWTSVTSFVHALAVSEVGPFVGNAGSSPPGHTALIDYVFDSNSPIVPEDPDPLSCVDASVDPIVDTPPVISTGIIAFEVDRLVTRSDRGFPWRQPPRAFANGDWTTPIDYAGGSLHFRAEIKGGGQPLPKRMRLQFCVWQDNLTKETCGSMKTIVGNPGNVVEWSDEISRMWKKDGVPIDWSRARQRYGIAIKNMDGNPVSDFSGWNWFGEDPDEWYPLDLRFTVRAVPAGEVFGGWGEY